MNMEVDPASQCHPAELQWGKKIAKDYPAFVQPNAIHVYFEVHPPIQQGLLPGQSMSEATGKSLYSW